MTLESNLKEEIVRKILSADGLSAEQWVSLLGSIPDATSGEPAEVQIARINADVHRRVWLKEGVVTAIVAAIVSLGTAYLTGIFDLESKVKDQESQIIAQKGELEKVQAGNSFQLMHTELNQRSGILERLLVIDPTQIGLDPSSDEYESRAAEERKARICLLSAFGILSISETMVGVPRGNLERYTQESMKFLEDRYACSKVSLPTSSWPAMQTEETQNKLGVSVDPTSFLYDQNNPRSSFDFEVRDGLLFEPTGPVPFYQSPNGGEFASLADIKFVVLDFAASANVAGSTQWMLRPESRASTHFLVGRYGEVIQLRRLDQTAWHAGRSDWAGLSGLNRYSFGVTLVNLGKLMNGRSWNGQIVDPADIFVGPNGDQWHTYTELQIKTTKGLISALSSAFPTIESVLDRSQISPGWKEGPGPAFEAVGAIVPRVFKN